MKKPPWTKNWKIDWMEARCGVADIKWDKA
jgi:hypothetical protein